MTDKRDVSGVWYGSYDADLWDERNGFIALLDEAGGAVSGTITERDTTGRVPVRRASVTGRRTGGTLEFVKQYDGTGSHDHAIRYAGTIDAEGAVVAGKWHVTWVRGSFTMEREKFSEASLEAEEAEERELETGRPV